MNDSRIAKFKIICYSILTTVAFSLDYAIVGDDVIKALVSVDDTLYGSVSNIVFRLLCAVECDGIKTITLAVVSLLVYSKTYSRADNNKADKWGIYGIDEIVMGLLMSLTYLFGKSFREFGTTQILVTGWTQMIKTGIVFCGSFLFFVNIVREVKVYARTNVCILTAAESKTDTEKGALYEIKLFLLFVAVWSIYLVAYYPGMFMGDTEDIIYMAFNYRCGLVETVELISEDVLLVDHHSVLHTLIVGMFIRVGRVVFHSDNIGIFLYTALQMIFTAWVLAYALYKLKKYGVGEWIRRGIICFFCLFPWIAKYAVTITKDTLFVDFLLLYLLELLDIINSDENHIDLKSRVRLSVYAILIFLFRKNGFYVIVLSLPFILKINKNWIWPVCSIMLTVILSKFVYTDIILPAADITQGSVRESLSVPLQQTGRYLKYYADEVSDEERAAIDAVVPYDIILSAYDSDSSDPIKNNWRKEADAEDIRNYLSVWGGMLKKHPMTYVAATASNYYAYFYPVVTDMYKAERTRTGSMANANQDGYFQFKGADNSISHGFRQLIGLENMMWMKIPLLNLFCTCALYVWGLICVWIRSCVKKDKKLLVIVIPLLFLVLTILAGPMNGTNYDRYVYPLAVCLPIVMGYGMRCFNERI